MVSFTSRWTPLVAVTHRRRGRHAMSACHQGPALVGGGLGSGRGPSFRRLPLVGEGLVPRSWRGRQCTADPG